MTRGLCPFATWRPTLNYGYPKGTHGQNRPTVFVDHIMGGYKSTMDNPAWLNASGISVQFGIGKDGSISQYVSIFDAAYGNGLTGIGGKARYSRDNPRLAAFEHLPGATWTDVFTNGVKSGEALIAAGVNVWNSHSISIEHEGVNQNTPWTEAMVEADIRIKRWCNAELAANGYARIPFDRAGIIGHNNIDAVNRPYCPGPGRPLGRIIAALQEDQMIRWNRVSDWYENPDHQVFEGSHGINARLDFALPAEAVAVELEISVRSISSSISAYDGDEIGNADPPGRAFTVERPALYFAGRVNLSDDGWCQMIGEGIANLRRVACVGYYTA